MSVSADDSSKTTGAQQPLSIRDEVMAMADAGDVNGVVDALSSDLGLHFTGNEKPDLVRRVLTAHASAGGPTAIINAVLGQMLSFDAELLLWSQTRIRAELRRDAKRENYLAGPSEGLVNEEFPRLARLEDRVILMAKTIATVQHTLAISQPGTTSKKGRVIRLVRPESADTANG